MDDNKVQQDFSHLRARERVFDKRDLLLGSVSAPVQIPPDGMHVDLSWLKRNFQGKTAFCGEHAGTHLKAILDYAASNGTVIGRKNPRYGAIKLKDPNSPVCDGFAIDAGTDMRSIFKWLQKVGADDFEPLENDVTLPGATYCNPSFVTPAMDALAAMSKISNYAFGDTDYASLCQYAWNSKAVLLLVRCDDGFWGTSAPTFTTPKYGHFVTMYDYDATGIWVIDSAEPDDAFALKHIAKQYITQAFIVESGTAVEISPEVQKQLAQFQPAPIPQNIAPTQQNVWLLTQIAKVYQVILNLINPKVGSGSTSMKSIYNGWISKTNWSAVVLVVVTVAQAAVPFMSQNVQDIVTAILGALIVIFHVQGVNKAAQSSAALGQAVSGQ